MVHDAPHALVLRNKSDIPDGSLNRAACRSWHNPPDNRDSPDAATFSIYAPAPLRLRPDTFIWHCVAPSSVAAAAIRTAPTLYTLTTRVFCVTGSLCTRQTAQVNGLSIRVVPFTNTMSGCFRRHRRLAATPSRSPIVLLASCLRSRTSVQDV
ncbi:hypothetical protein DFH08DRAFT_483176 [Mycena albidolilacea]|uniref:Uncharacterized protein n=1 Tax=Mycena albidolilacea TaxID=1033008 RepID=A0AAD6Z6W7_9AGAR|nr:hypothetical protein DFH08DRAFT_483176 [Mycena albidolilacea]